jgi:hypothetical protein
MKAGCQLAATSAVKAVLPDLDDATEGSYGHRGEQDA